MTIFEREKSEGGKPRQTLVERRLLPAEFFWWAAIAAGIKPLRNFYEAGRALRQLVAHSLNHH